MSFSQAALANQKLTFARLALNSARAQPSDGDIHTRLALHAHLDAGVNHLSQALAFFLREIAEQYKVKIGTPALDPGLIFEELYRQHANTAEVAELKSLLENPGWLRDMIEAARDPRQLASQFKSASESPSHTATEAPAGLIPVRSLSAASPEPTDLLGQWLQNLQLLIDRLRMTLVEE